MFGIGWDVLQPKGNIIAPIVFIPAKKKTPKMRGSFAMQATKMSMLKAIHGYSYRPVTVSKANLKDACVVSYNFDLLQDVHAFELSQI